MAEWTEVLSDTGFDVLAKERLPKDMEFQPWAERHGLRCGSPSSVCARMLTDGSAGAQGVPQAARRERQALVYPG